MSTLNSSAVEEGMKELKRISADEEERHRALARERALLNRSLEMSPFNYCNQLI